MQFPVKDEKDFLGFLRGERGGTVFLSTIQIAANAEFVWGLCFRVCICEVGG